MKLLLVDNDHDMVEMLAGWLKTLGYDVFHAYTGERAKIEWAKHQPDLVILDTALKDVDGIPRPVDKFVAPGLLVWTVLVKSKRPKNVLVSEKR